ncbi:MAG: radical SAM protein [Clostridia bacterium]|nr:radical SAM protein [Clostridia bacterium]
MSITSQLQKALIEKAKQLRKPISVNFELLPVCNLKCKMCYIRTDTETVDRMGGLLSADDWITIAKGFKEQGSLFLLLTGGEVFLYPEFKRLYVELFKMGFSITINTNGTLIDEKAVSWLRQYPPKCISISLYGASNETYERLCGIRNMFSRVDHAVKLLYDNQIRFEFKTMLTPLNAHDADACLAYARRYGVYYEQAAYAFPPLRKSGEDQQCRFTAEEAAEQTIGVNLRMAKPEEFREGIVKHLKKYEDTRHISGTALYGFTCGATRSSCWITWRGHMTPCAMLEWPFTKPINQGVLPAWEELKEKCDTLLMSNKCSYCDKRGVCTTCPAANRAETGSFEECSEYHCKMTECILNEMRKKMNEWNEQ